MKMKIAFVITRIPFGLRYWNYIIDALEEQGCAVTVFTGLAPGISSDQKKIVSCGAWQVTTRKKGYNRVFTLVHPRLAWEVARIAPDVVISIEYTSATMFACLGARWCGARFVIFQEHSSRKDLEPGVVRRLWRKMLLKLSDLVIANTPQAASEITRLNPRCEKKITLVPLLVPPNRRDMMKVAIKLPIECARPIFTYVGQLIPQKNVDSLLKAAKILKDEGLRFSVWIVGDGPERGNLQSAVRDWGLEDAVWFFGVVPYESLGFIYDQTDVLIMPTFSDYRSVAVLEALRFGKPVIDSVGDGNAGSTVLDGINGFVFNPYDVKELTILMKRFIESPELIENMGRESEKRICTPEQSADLLLRTLNGLGIFTSN